jgi:hypothetical protein
MTKVGNTCQIKERRIICYVAVVKLTDRSGPIHHLGSGVT